MLAKDPATLTPSAVTAAMIATAISKARKAYSIEAVPRSSQMNLRRREFIAGPLKRSGNSSGGGPGVTPEPPSQDGLLQLVRNRRERAGQLRAERRHGADGATAMSAAMRPYSMAVAPDSS